MSQLHCVLQLRVTLVCVVLLCFATQGHAGLHFNIKVRAGGFPYVNLWKSYFWHWGLLMESGELDEGSFLQFLRVLEMMASVSILSLSLPSHHGVLLQALAMVGTSSMILSMNLHPLMQMSH